MFRSFIVLASLLFLISCQKEDKGINVSGKVVDVVTQQPVQGLRLGPFSLKWDFNIYNPVRSYYVFTVPTDAGGRFAFQVSPKETYYLGADNIPAAYISEASINGKPFILYQENGTEYWHGHIGLSDNTEYTIELYPRTWWRFDIPEVPESWQGDTLFIRLNDRVLFSGDGTWNQSSPAFFKLFEPVHRNQAKALQSCGANFRVSGSFYVGSGTVVHKNGIFNVLCAPKDTTVVWLDLQP